MALCFITTNSSWGFDEESRDSLVCCNGVLKVWRGRGGSLLRIE